jgi:hypothetical protein
VYFPFSTFSIALKYVTNSLLAFSDYARKMGVALPQGSSKTNGSIESSRSTAQGKFTPVNVSGPHHNGRPLGSGYNRGQRRAIGGGDDDGDDDVAPQMTVPRMSLPLSATAQARGASQARGTPRGRRAGVKRKLQSSDPPIAETGVPNQDEIRGGRLTVDDRQASSPPHKQQRIVGANGLRRIDPNGIPTVEESLVINANGKGPRRAIKPVVSGHHVVSTSQQQRQLSDDDSGASEAGGDDTLFLDEEEGEAGEARVTSNHTIRQKEASLRGSFQKITKPVSAEAILEDNPRTRPFQKEPGQYLYNLGDNLAASRFSGASMPWGVNKNPKAAVQVREMTDASKLKRDIAKAKGSKTKGKRANGASDPENIDIINLKDIDNMPFEAIAAHLNQKRVQNGRVPSLTTCAVAGRYNRNAPLHYAAQGKTFVPVSQRKKDEDGNPINEDEHAHVTWTADLDVQLVEATKDHEKGKWATIADIFEEKTGVQVTALQCSVRFSML